jgi:probable HAF family extracellular repeat protein
MSDPGRSVWRLLGIMAVMMIVGALMAGGAWGAAPGSTVYQLERSWPPQLSASYGIASDGNGHVYVVDQINNHILKLEAVSGAVLAAWGSLGSGTGQFNKPVAVAVDGSGNVYVTDSNNNRIQKFSTEGDFLLELGIGQIISPTGIAVDSGGSVYVAQNSTISKFTSDGTLLFSWDGSIGGDILLSNPSHLAVVGGIVYVSDYGNNRVRKFSAVDGASLGDVGLGPGSGQGQFNGPSGVTVDGSGNTFVMESNNQRLQKFNANGEWVFATGTLGNGNGQFNNPSAIAVDSSGNLYVMDSNNYRVQKLAAADGAFQVAWGVYFTMNVYSGYGNGPGQFQYPAGAAVDGRGNIYVADQNNHRFQKFAPNGSFIFSVGSFGTGPSAPGAVQFYYPFGIAVDGNGNVYVADQYNHRIQKFAEDGSFLLAWGTYGSGLDQFMYPSGVAVDRGNGFVYVADQNNHRIQKFTTDGTYLNTWGSQGNGSGQFQYPLGIAVAQQNGSVYIADQNNHRIQRFTSDGTFLNSWGNQGNDNGQFQYPSGIAIDVDGNIYIADTNNDRIQMFDVDGNFLTTWGTSGFGLRVGAAQFFRPVGVAVDNSGNVYVADEQIHRIQKFNPRPDLYVTTVQTNPQGLKIMVDGTAYTAPQTFNWAPGSNHTIATVASDGGWPTRKTFDTWSDGGAISHTITAPSAAATYTANFITQYQLIIYVGSGSGSVTPASLEWYNAGDVVPIQATANSGYLFAYWNGQVADVNSAATTVTMNGTQTVWASFSLDIPSVITVQTSPPGFEFTVDGTTYTTPQTFTWAPRSSHTIGVTSPQIGWNNASNVFRGWSNAGSLAQTTITVPFSNQTYTATLVESNFSPTTGNMNAARFGHTATMLNTGKVLIAGGNGLSSAELYDPATGTFTLTGSMAALRYGHTATLVPGGNVLIAGGNTNAAELYNPATGTFTSTGSMTTARNWHTATLLPTGKVLVAGGISSTAGVMNSAELYNPLTGTFTPTGNMTSVRTGHTATLLSTGMVLIAGGRSYFGVLNSAEVYNPLGTFSPAGGMLGARANHTATMLGNGRILFAGGGPFVAELFDQNFGMSSFLAYMITPRSNHTATLLNNGQVLFSGGISSTNTPLSSAELVSPASGQFTPATTMANPRSGHTATLLADGKVLIAGGGSNSAELFTTPPASTGSTFIPGPNATAIYQNSPFSYTPSAPGATSFRIANKPSWASFDPATGALSGTPGPADVRVYSNIIITVTDGVRHGSVTFTLTVLGLPTISGTPPGSVTQGQFYTFTPYVTNATGFSITNQPSWASFNTVTGTLSGTPYTPTVGLFSDIVITALNGMTSAALPAFSITVLPVQPTISGIPLPTANAEALYRFTPTASLFGSFIVSGMPSWATFDPATGTLSGMPALTDVGTTSNITITAVNGDKTASMSFMITVLEPSPYTIIDLGSLSGNYYSFSRAKAVSGTIVVGYTDNLAIAWDTSVSPPTIRNLGQLGGGYGMATGVSGSVITGWSYDINYDTHAFAYDLAAATPQMIDLGPNNGSYIGVSGTVIVGWSKIPGYGAFMYDLAAVSPRMVALGALPGDSASMPTGISGHIVVGSSYNSDGTSRAVVWDISVSPPEIRDLGTLGGPSSHATAVDGSLVVGWANAANGTLHVFAYDLSSPSPRMIDLGTLPGIEEIKPIVVKGSIVAGYSYVYGSGHRAFACDLSATLPQVFQLGSLPGGSDSEATGVSGKIIFGYAATANGSSHAYAYDLAAANPQLVDLGTASGNSGNSYIHGVDGSHIVGATKTDNCNDTHAAIWVKKVDITIATSPAGLSFTVDGGGVTYTSPQSFKWAQGSSHTIVITSPQTGSNGGPYGFTGWSDGNGEISRTIIVPDTAATYTAQFAPQYLVTTSAGPNGSITPATASWYTTGTSATVVTTPDTGYHISKVLVDGIKQKIIDPKSFSTTFANISTNHTVSATFAIDTFTITTCAGANGTITPAATVNFGTNPTVTVTPNIGYHISTVVVDGVTQTITNPKNFSTTFTAIFANHTVSATFAIDTFTISTTAGSGGSITPSLTVKYGVNANVMVTPNKGYHIEKVVVDGSSKVIVTPNKSFSYTFTKVSDNHTVTATFGRGQAK